MIEPTDVIKAALKALGEGDMDSFASILHPEVVTQTPGKSVLAGTYSEVSEVLGLFGKIGELSDGTFPIDEWTVFGNAERAVGVYRVSAERDGKRFEWMARSPMLADTFISSMISTDSGRRFAWDDFACFGSKRSAVQVRPPRLGKKEERLQTNCPCAYNGEDGRNRSPDTA